MICFRMATMRDIAEKTGVSIKTVSRAINGDGYVAKDRKELILRVAQELNYTPNLHARTLKTRRSHEIVVPLSSTDELHMAKLAGLAGYLRDKGYIVSLFFYHRNSTDTELRSHSEQLLARNPAGIVLLGPHPALLEYWINLTGKIDLPLVAVDPPSLRGQERSSGTAEAAGIVNQIRLDRSKGVKEAIHYLAGRGYKRIAYAGPRCDTSRKPGYSDAISELGREKIIFSLDDKDLKGGYRKIADRILDGPERPDAVQMYSDEGALFCLSRLHERQVQVPHDIAVVGFDDRWAADKASPSLTTVAQPSGKLGEMAGRMILKAMRKELDAAGECWSTATHLVIRDSA